MWIQLTPRMPASVSPSSADLGPQADRLRLDRQLCFALYSASNLMVRAYGPHLEELGLTYPQYVAMLALWSCSPRTVGNLADELMLNFGTLSPLLKRLEARGLVVRRRDVQDERRVLVELTPRGQALRQDALDMQDRLRCLVDLPLDALVELRERTQALVSTLLRDPGRQASPPSKESSP